MKDNLKFILIIIGICAIFFIMGREITETRSELRKTKDQISQQKEEKSWLQGELNSTKGELVKTSRDLRASRDKLTFINSKIMLLKGNNDTLLMVKQGLEYKIAALEEEKRIMYAKLNSLSDLKNAIRKIKTELRNEKIKQQKELDKWETASGNRGFLTKDGVYYYKPKVNVEVRPANLSLNKK